MNDFEREEKLKAARQKLKAFRAKKAAKESSSHVSTSSDEPIASTSKALESPTRKSRHAHRRSNSRSSISMPAAQTHSRRNSTRRHSRTDSISHVPINIIADSLPAISPIPPMDAPASLSTWSFPRSSSSPLQSSPRPPSSGFAAEQRSLAPRRASLQHPPPSPSAGAAVTAPAPATLLAQRRASLQLEAPKSSFSPTVSPNPTMPAFMPSPVLPEAGPSMSSSHNRRGSRHSRQVSVSTRRESMEIMSGTSFDPQPPTSPKPETDRFAALDALEGRSPTNTTIPLPVTFPPAFLSTLSAGGNKRSSWSAATTPSPNSIAMTGGRGASDLGMLIEEEEGSGEEPEAESPTSFTLAAAPSTRRRPVSLFLPSKPPQAPNPYGTTSDMPSPSEDESPVVFPSMTPRNLRTLSMSTAATSPSPTATFDPAKRAGLRTLTLSGASDVASPIAGVRRRSLISGPSSATSPTTNGGRNARRSSVNIGQAAGKRTSISYRSAASSTSPSDSSFGFGDLVMDGDFSLERTELQGRISRLEMDLSNANGRAQASEADLARVNASLSSRQHDLQISQAQLAALQAELASHGDMGARVVELESEIAEQAERFTAQIDTLREQCNDAVMERDDLKEDVDGWRNRCADLARAVERERARVDEERREGAAAREQVRKLGERLAAASASAASNSRTSADEALAEAQAKLIGEMRDQIFSLAGALEQEKTANAVLRREIESSFLPAVEQEQVVEDDVPAGVHNRGSDAGSSIASSLFGSRNSFGITPDNSGNSFSTLDSVEVPSPSSRPGSTGPGGKARDSDQFGSVPITLGGLQTLAEEDEESTEEEEELVDETHPPQLEPSGTSHGVGSAGSTCSTVSESMPKTPIKESPPMGQREHRRSHSFIKAWTFPKGPVEPVHIVQPDDHSFFAISNAAVLPPLPIPAEVLALPDFCNAGLVFDESFAKVTSEAARRALVPSREATVTMTSTPPPIARAIRGQQMSVSSIASSTDAPLCAPQPTAKALARMSLQNFGSLISSYVAPPPAPAPAPQLKHGRQDSMLFAGEGDDRPPLLLAKTSGPRRTITAREQPRPQASPLDELDFTQSCAPSPRQQIPGGIDGRSWLSRLLYV